MNDLPTYSILNTDQDNILCVEITSGVFKGLVYAYEIDQFKYDDTNFHMAVSVLLYPDNFDEIIQTALDIVTEDGLSYSQQDDILSELIYKPIILDLLSKLSKS